MFYTLTNRDGQQTLSVIGETFEKVIASTHPNFATLVTYLTTNDPNHDEEYVRGLVDPTVGIGRILQEHFGDRVSYDLHHLYLDGLPVQGALANVVKQRMLAADQDWLRFTKFLVNLDANPSKRAKEATWLWVERNGLTITEDGCFLGYKGVNHDGTSKSSGPDNYVNGTYYGKPGVAYHVPHEIGTVVSKKRADVDDTPGGGCSVGLHVGTKDYATGFGPRLLTVKINPADVVSAPDRDLEWKIRVCRYEVIDLAKDEYFSSTSADPVTAEHVKSEERVSREAELAGLDESERKDYEEFRKQGYIHENALAAVREGDDPFEEDDVETDEVVEESNDVETIAVSFDGSPVSIRLVVPAKEEPTLADWAEVNDVLRSDLENTDLGHKPLARKWSDITSEASVRRYRKSNGIKTSFSAKVKDAVS